MRKHSALMGSVLAMGLGLSLLPGSAAADDVGDALAAARAASDAGRCRAAEQEISAIPGLASRGRLLAGQCEIRAGRYPEALERLDGIRAADDLSSEQVGDVELYRAIALYHLERYSEARAALSSADGLTRDEAQLSLYRGLLALREGDNDRAAPALESAARLAPEQTEPVASYYAGLAWLGAAERNRARDAFQRVIDIDGEGAWGKEAAKLLDSTELYPYFVRGRVGIEWDDNVLLRGDVQQIAAPNESPLSLAGEDDWRGVWEIDGGVQLFQSDDGKLAGGVTASYQGNAHRDLSDINLHYPTIGAYLSQRLATNTVGQVRYQFGHAWVDENPYLRSHVAEASVAHTWTRAGTTTFLADVIANDLRFNPFDVPDNTSGTPGPGSTCVPASTLPCSPPGVNEVRERERDGYGVGGAIDHRYLVPVPDGLSDIFEQVEVGGGYRFRFYDSEGDEWEHYSHIFSASMGVELPLDFRASTYLSYEYRDFQNPSTFPDVETNTQEYALASGDRSEHEIIFKGEIEKDITENVSVSGRYSYLNNDSNRDAYNYDRHVVGGYLNFRFD